MLITDKESLSHLKKLNQLALTEAEDTDTLAFFAARDANVAKLNEIDTENVEPMVHVMPTVAAVREDKAIKRFTRDELQATAPKSHDGYLQVPRVVE